jgi:ATP-dependent DNA helicase Rep
MVIAGPGAGKTFLIVERIKRLADSGAMPPETGVLTFSNKAADELRGRLGSSLIEQGLSVSTFHSLGLKFIKENPGVFGLCEGFILLNDEERLHLLKSLSPEKISGAGTLLRNISAYKQGIDTDIAPAIIEEYNSCLIKNNSIDVDDLIYLPCVMAEVSVDVRRVISSRFTHIMIDEFQDINFMQYRFIRLLAPDAGADIFVIGDPDQSIYGFRGASPNTCRG